MQHQVDCNPLEWRDKIPFMRFPTDWEIRFVPNFNESVVRFMVRKNGVTLSVFLDGYDKMGVVGEPYWSIYPNKKREPSRYLLNDTAGLIEGLRNALRGDGLEG